jgi:hypothetical protein
MIQVYFSINLHFVSKQNFEFIMYNYILVAGEYENIGRQIFCRYRLLSQNMRKHATISETTSLCMPINIFLNRSSLKFISIAYKNSVSTSQKTHYVSITTTIWFTLFRERITSYFQDRRNC